MVKEKKYRIFADEPASDWFRLLLAQYKASDDENNILDCFCGRTILNSNWKEGLDKDAIYCVENAIQEKPRKFVLIDTDLPLLLILYRGKFYIDCPCNYARKLECEIDDNQAFLSICLRTLVEERARKLAVQAQEILLAEPAKIRASIRKQPALRLLKKP